MKFFRTLLLLLLASALVSACDCGGSKNKCDCKPTVTFTSPSGSTPLTEFHDTNPSVDGIQYPVGVSTTCIAAGTVLVYTNSLRTSEKVNGTVVIDDAASESGHIDFGSQTFVEGTQHVCVQGAVNVDRTAKDLTTSCSPNLQAISSPAGCKDVVVQLGVPACRFDSPVDGTTLIPKDDSNPEAGFQHDIRLSCKGVSDGTTVRLIVDGRKAVEASLANKQVVYKDMDLAEGSNLLRAETTGTGGEKVVTEIGVTVDTGGCALRVLPPDGTTLRANDDEDTKTAGLQLTLTVETDSAGAFSCKDGSAVNLSVAGQPYSGTLANHSAKVQVTFSDGTVAVFATATESGANGRTARSLTNNYFVCATPMEITISAPHDGLTITDSADQDKVKTGIQVAVRGTTKGIPAAGNLQLVVDGQVVLDTGGTPLVPTTFFPGGDFEFQYASFLQSKNYTLQVNGTDACTDQGQSDISTVTVQTQQRTCQITDPANGATLLAVDDKDHNPANDLQYDVKVVTANVPDGSTFTLYISGQAALPGLVINGNQNTSQASFTDGRKDLQCVLASGEASPVNTITVDGHSPTISITSPADGTSFGTADVTIELATTGVEDGQLAKVVVSDGTNQATVQCTVTGNAASCPVTLFGVDGTCVANTVTATVSDKAGNASAPASIGVQACVSTNPPVVTFIDPDETQAQPIAVAEADRVYTVIVKVGNVAPGTKVQLVVVDNGQDRAPLLATVNGTGFATFANVLLPRGSVELQASASNAAGPTTESMMLTVGTAGLPLVIIVAPPDGTYTKDTVQAITVHTDAETGQTCYICSRATPGTPSLPPDCTSASSIAQGVVNGSGDAAANVTLVQGSFDLWASCTNLAAATGTSVPNLVVVDLTAPTVAFAEPLNNAIYNAASVDRSGATGFQIRIQVTADVEDGQPASLTIDSQPAQIIGTTPVFAGGLISFGAVTIPDLPLQHVLDAHVCDRAGNCGDAPQVNILVDRQAPGVSISDPPDLDKLGAAQDSSLAAGYQYNVVVLFTGAMAGDSVLLERNVNSTGWAQIDTYTVASDGESGHTFANATIVPGPDPVPKSNVQIRATITDAASNSSSAAVSVVVNVSAPIVIITRPTDGANLNIFSDMSSDPGFQTQVNVDTYNTSLGDTLVLCVSPGTGFPVGHCTGHGNEAWAGTVTGVTTFISNVNLDQGDNTLVAYAENIPGQGTYSAPITVHVDSIPPVVTAFTVTSDADHNGCISQAEGTFQASATVTEDGTASLVRNWPGGAVLWSGNVTGGAVAIGLSLPDDVYDLTLVVTDGFGNPNVNVNPPITNPLAHLALKVDTVVPVIAITAPSKTTLNSGDDLDHSTPDVLDFNFSASSTAEDGQAVTFKIDGTTAGTQALSGGLATLRTLMGQNGHTLLASVSDSCGNPATPATLSVSVDTVPPTISCSQPTTGATFNTSTVPFTCTTTGTDSTQHIVVVSTTGGQRCSPLVDASGTTSFNCSLQAGVQDLTVTVTDPAGNVSTPFIIRNVTVSLSGCSIVFTDPTSAAVVFNATNDKDGNPANGLQKDVSVNSGCTSSSCPACQVTLLKNGIQVAGPTVLDSSGNVIFANVQFADGEMGTQVTTQIDDGAGHINSDLFVVDLVDLYPPQLSRQVPGGDAVTCVASSGNPTVNGTTILADKMAGAPCEMDFSFTVTNGPTSSYNATLTIFEGASAIAGPTTISSSPQTVTYTSLPLSDNAVHNLSVEAKDYAGNVITIPMTVTVDVTAPGVIAAAAALDTNSAASRHADVKLTWNAVGDDGTTGTATAYELRWSLNPIATEADWTAATQITGLPNPKVAGSAESFVAQWLPPLNTYHLSLRAVDEVGNVGAIPADVALANLWNVVDHVGPANATFGYQVFSAGDINKDTYDDLIATASTYNGNQGAVKVLYGEANLANWSNPSTGQLITRGSAGERFGYDVATRGDLDGDGIPDIVVSGHGFGSNRGRVSIYFGRNGAQLPANPDIEIRAAAGTANQFGRSVEIIGDINHDGYADLFVSAPTADVNGRGYIFFGRPRTTINPTYPNLYPWEDTTHYATGNDGDGINYVPVSSANINFLGINANDWFGFRWGATTLGDVDGDGYADFALVASSVNQLYTFDGNKISAITGRDVNPAAAPGGDSVDVITDNGAIPDTAFRAGFGTRAVGGFDVTGDSIPDLVVADAYGNTVYLYQGGSSGVADPPTKILPPVIKQVTPPDNIYFGFALELGDINMDGKPDMLVGSNSTSGNRAFLFINHGASPFFGDVADSVLTSTDYFGIGLAIGDFNHDGLPDIAVGRYGLSDLLLYY